jgi:hypothetical protein
VGLDEVWKPAPRQKEPHGNGQQPSAEVQVNRVEVGCIMCDETDELRAHPEHMPIATAQAECREALRGGAPPGLIGNARTDSRNLAHPPIRLCHSVRAADRTAEVWTESRQHLKNPQGVALPGVGRADHTLSEVQGAWLRVQTKRPLCFNQVGFQKVRPLVVKPWRLSLS